MAVSTLVVSGIKPMLEMLGNEQKFIVPELNNFGIVGIENTFNPTPYMNSISHYQLENINHCGFRLSHTTDTINNLGMLQLQYFINGSYDSTPLMTFKPDGITFNVDVDIPIPASVATKEYVDDHTWLSSSITDLEEFVLNHSLDQFSLPIAGDINLNSNKITNLVTPTAGTDAATKAYVDNSATSPVVTLSGAISGSGNTGTTINTTLNTTLNNIPAATADLNLNSHKITSLAIPTISTDAATKGYVDTSISGLPASTVTLQGDISGTGNTGSPISTTLNKRLDQIAAPTSSVGLNGQKITSLGTPTLDTDAATKLYVDTNNPSSSITLQGAITGTGATGTPISTSLNTTLNNIPIPTASVSLNSQKITNLGTPTINTDAATKSYVDASHPSSNITLQGAITGSGLTGAPISTTLNTTLNNIPIPTAAVSLNSQKITSLATPTVATDATTKGYVDSAISSIPASSIILQGDISGTGTTGTAFNTTLNKTLNSIAIPTEDVNLNYHKIINLLTPTNLTDAASKGYVDSHLPSSSITLTGAISGSGTTGSSITTTINSKLNQIPIPTANVDINNNNIINLSAPTTGLMGANKNYVDQISNISGSSNITVTGNNPKVINLATTTVVSGVYTSPTLTIDVNGRITNAINGGNSYGTLIAGNYWKWYEYNNANIQLTSDINLLIDTGNVSVGILYVKQDSIGNRKLYLPAGIYRNNGQINSQVTLTTTPLAIDILIFRRDYNGIIYLENVIYNMTPTRTILDYSGAQINIPIHASINNVCRVKLLGAGGGSSVSFNTTALAAYSGAGGFTIYHFDTTSFLGQELKIKVGQGGEGGIRNSRAGNGGYPNGCGRGIRGQNSVYRVSPGGGGGRSECRIGTQSTTFDLSTLIAIAGAGGGGAGNSSVTACYSGAGGEIGQSCNLGGSTGGNQGFAGTSEHTPSVLYFPPSFSWAGYRFGAGSSTVITIDSIYSLAGGGDGYFGGGTYFGEVLGASGGSGFMEYNNYYIEEYNGVSSGMYSGNYNLISTQASSDPDFSGGVLGVGKNIVNNSDNGLTGGNGRVVVEFF